ncbi:hypothetical protein NNO_0607 [Hydrogenimonas sp.]|nr:hypothetical protein NNO_0607 [Hydrogenimonas sp.]
MKKSIVVSVLFASILSAQSLSDLYREVENSSLYKSRIEAIEADRRSAEAGRLSDGWSAGADLAGAYPKDGSSSGGEFSVSISKEFNLKRSALARFMHYNKNYSELRKRVELNRIKARIFRLYGEYCISKEALNAQRYLASIYKEMLKQIDTGVRFGEFDVSKALMAHLALENLNLKIVDTESRLRGLEGEISSIIFFDSAAECSLEEFDSGYLLNPENSAFYPMLELKSRKMKEGLELSRSRIPGLELTAQYSDEIDTRRATIGLSIPLSFGKRSEAERAAALHAYTAARNEAAALKRAYESSSEALLDRLNLYNTKVRLFESSINLTTDTLIEQSRIRFKAGEESLLSLLKATETKLQMIEALIGLKTKRHDAVSDFIEKYAIDPQGVIK